MENIVEIRHVNKVYSGVHVLKNVSCTIQTNKIYGLLGRNGAGKTTLMKLITAQLLPTDGEIKVFGENPYENDRVLSKVCFIKESQKYPDMYRVKDAMDVAASIFPNWDREYALRLVNDFHLPLKRKIKSVSRGMLSSVGIIIGLASRAPLTFFDEPYLGLDAISRSVFYDRLIEDFAQHPRTIVLSTHLIDEVSQLLEHIILIDQGTILVDDEADALRGKAYVVTGPAEKVELFAAGKRKLHQETLGQMVAVTFMNELTETDRQRAAADGLKLQAISMQQFMVRMSQSNNAREAVNGV